MELTAGEIALLDEALEDSDSEYRMEKRVERAVLDIVRWRMAEAWDEGHRFTGYEPERGENPYRTQ